MDKTKGVRENEINKIKKYIKDEKFDTDSLFYDAEHENESNILSQTKSEILKNTICEYIRFRKGITLKFGLLL